MNKMERSKEAIMTLRVWWFLVSSFAFAGCSQLEVGMLNLPFVNKQTNDLVFHSARP